METVVVTRHGALVDFLRERQIIGNNAKVIAHAAPDDIRGKRVVGVLPLRLACLAAEVVEVDLDIPAELRSMTAKEMLPKIREMKIPGMPATIGGLRAMALRSGFRVTGTGNSTGGPVTINKS